MSPDYYEVLGCGRGCTQKEIKSAYHHLISKFHPDRNSDPTATQFTVRLNEAYAVLGDERRRVLYDAWINSSHEQPGSKAESDAKVSREAPPIKCSRCGRQDETIRLTLMYYVISLLLITYRRGSSGIWCQKCRAFEAAKWTCLSGLLGWWGVPWGPVYTIQALFVNGKGGLQPRTENAAVLRVLGYQFYQQGRLAEAFVTLREALWLEWNAEASQLFEYLRPQQSKTPERRKRSAILANLATTASPSLLMAALFLIGVYRVANEPSGYEASYQAPKAMAKSAGSQEAPPRSRANTLISDLAGIVESRAPVVGSHHEGATLVTDHELDRSKFDEAELYPIADSIGTELHSAAVDGDGFLASAYFNAELFALSVDVEKRLEQGRAIDAQVGAVLRLGTDPAVSGWLQSSRFQHNYATLSQLLRSYSRRYHPGTATEELSQQYRKEESELEGLKARLGELKSAGDEDAYNALIPEYNAGVRRLNSVVNQGTLRSVAGKKLDLAFNRCLDPGILMSKFQQVNLATHSAEIDSLADPVTPSQ